MFAKNAEVLEAVKTGERSPSPMRSRPGPSEMDFSPPFLEIELGYLVPKDPAYFAEPDIDPGLRVGVTQGTSSDGALSRDLKNAQVVRATTFVSRST